MTARVVPWSLPALVFGWVLLGTEVPVGSFFAYAGYFAGGVTLPGLLLFRALSSRGGRTWPEDLGLGTAVGLCYELAGFALFTSLGIQRWLLVWPALLIAVFLAVPRLRQHWRARDVPRLPVAWSVALAVLTSSTLLMQYGGSVSRQPLPPDAPNYYPDLLWHLSIVHELGRALPPQIPQVAGEPMQYHWFADAHLAAAVEITGVSAELVLFRLWFAPIVLTMVLAMAALARQVSRVWWTAPLTVLVVPLSLSVDIWRHSGQLTTSPLSNLSPSQTFGSTLSVATVAVLAGVLFQGAPRRSWILLGLLVAVCAGSKPTTLPMLLGGTGLAAAMLLVWDRRIPWRPVLTGVGLAGVLLLSMITVVGSTAGTRPRVLGLLRVYPGYSELTGDQSLPSTGGWLIPGVRHLDGRIWLFVLVILLAAAVSQVPSLVTFFGLGYRGTRTSPVHWWLAGAVLAGWLGFLVVDHPGAGQFYFLGSVTPFAAVAASNVLAVAVRAHSHPVRRTVLVGGLIAGAVLSALVLTFGNLSDPPDVGPEVTTAVGVPLLWLAFGGLAGTGGWLLLRRRRPVLRGLGVVLAVSAAVGLVLPARQPSEWTTWTDRVVGPLNVEIPPLPPYARYEALAALWLRDNSAPGDVVVTNTACVLPREEPECDTRGYLVSGIGGRRTLLEGWAYTQQSMANQGLEGLRYNKLPSPWPGRLAETEAAITKPTPALLARLHREYGVRWVFADVRKGRVARADLDRLAELRRIEGAVLIYRLRDT